MKLKLSMLALALFSLLFMSCSSDEKDTNNNHLPQTESELKETIEKKWDVSSSNSDFSSIELKDDGTYYIVEKDGTIHIGDYTISDDLKTITLDGLGTMVLESLNDGKLGLKFTPEGSTIAQNITCTPSNDVYEMKILVAKEYMQLYTYNMDGSGELNVLTLSGSEYIDDYNWAQNGAKIAVHIYDENTNKVILMNPDGSGKQDLQQKEGSNISPDGKTVVYEDDYNIYTCSIDGSNIKKVTDYEINGDSWAEEPSWSPDGKSIIYISRSNSSNTEFIHTIGIDRTNKKNLTSSDKGIYDPQISPNGRYVSYILDNDIVVCDITGQNNRVIANSTTLIGDDGWFNEPCWTPDGRIVAVALKSNGAEEYGVIINADGSNYKKLNITGNVDNFKVAMVKK